MTPTCTTPPQAFHCAGLRIVLQPSLRHATIQGGLTGLLVQLGESLWFAPEGHDCLKKIERQADLGAVSAPIPEPMATFLVRTYIEPRLAVVDFDLDAYEQQWEV